jgi:hypothetical protein
MLLFRPVGWNGKVYTVNLVGEMQTLDTPTGFKCWDGLAGFQMEQQGLATELQVLCSRGATHGRTLDVRQTTQIFCKGTRPPSA